MTGRQFIWDEEKQQIAFEDIKRLVWPAVLNLPDNKGRFHLYSVNLLQVVFFIKFKMVSLSW